MSDRGIEDLATAVTDGDVIDWPTALSRIHSPETRSAAEGLQLLDSLNSSRGREISRESRRLPLLLEGTHVTAIICTVVGLSGFAFGLPGSRPVRAAIMLAVLVTFGGVAAYLDIGGRDRRARALSVCYWTTAVSFSARGLIQLLQLWPMSFALRVLASFRPEAFFAAALWQFSRDFPTIMRFSRLDRMCQVGLQITLALGLALFISNTAVSLEARSTVGYLLAPFQRLAGDGPLFWNLVFGTAIPALLVIAMRGRSAVGAERTRVRIFLYSVAISFGPVMTQVFLEGLFPSYMKLTRTPAGLFWSGLFVYPPLFVLPIATAYAISAENVLGVRAVVQRGVRYLLAKWLLMWGACLPFAILVIHLFKHDEQSLAAALTIPPAPLLLWITGIGVVMLMFRNTLIRALDRWVLNEGAAPSAVLADMTNRLKQARTPLEVALALADGSEIALQSPSVAYVCVDGVLTSSANGGPPKDTLIRVLLSGSREPCVVSSTQSRSYYSLLTEQDRRWIEREAVEILVPVLTRRSEDTLVAMVALKRRNNALGFSEDDLRFLRASAAAASLACDAIASEPRHAEHAFEELAIQCDRCGRVEEWTADTERCRCGGRQEPAVLPKRLLSRYHVHQQLGAGGMGIVYQATDTLLGREVAIKTLPSLSDEAAGHLVAEARTMASLSPADVAVLYGTERWRGTPLLIMEYLPGGSLASRLRSGPLSESQAVSIARRLAGVLQHVHATNRYHGDIKPGNIGFSADNTPRLLDFGLAQAITRSEDGDDRGLDERSTVCGTRAYMSPEARRGEPAGQALDLWGLSVVLCEILLGAHPFPAANRDDDIALGAKTAVSRLRTQHHTVLCDVVARALSFDPSDRYASAADLEQALAQTLNL